MKDFAQNIYRILIVDDTSDIHEDIRKVLSWSKPSRNALKDLEAELFADSGAKPEDPQVPLPELRIESAYQGAEALEMVEKALQDKDPFHLIFMDVRMPPGMDGVEATQKIWQLQPDVGVIICTAYSDYSIEAIQGKLGISDHLLFLTKPFSPSVLKQSTVTLLKKGFVDRERKAYIEQLKIQLRKQLGDDNR